MYAEPHRYYHNQKHIADCLGEFDRVRQLAVEPDAVEFAVWFHDAVYDSRASDNEERSAVLAQAWLKRAGAAAPLANSVHQLVHATKFHDGTLHPDAPLLVDMDLAILGQSPQRFWEYEQGIRAEYEWVDQITFATKRTDILQRFLARTRIYHTEIFFAQLEAQARSNLRASIEQLQRSA